MSDFNKWRREQSPMDNHTAYAAEAAWKSHEMLTEMSPENPDQMLSVLALMEVYRENLSVSDSLMDILRQNSEKGGDLENKDYFNDEGTYAVARKAPRKAIEWFERSADKGELKNFGARYFAAEAYMELGEVGEAVRLLEGSLTRYSDKWTPVTSLLALCHYKLGLAYEASGWTRKAIEKYQFFLELWKDADPGLPAVEDAKARLQALQS